MKNAAKKKNNEIIGYQQNDAYYFSIKANLAAAAELHRIHGEEFFPVMENQEIKRSKSGETRAEVDGLLISKNFIALIESKKRAKDFNETKSQIENLQKEVFDIRNSPNYYVCSEKKIILVIATELVEDTLTSACKSAGILLLGPNKDHIHKELKLIYDTC